MRPKPCCGLRCDLTASMLDTDAAELTVMCLQALGPVRQSVAMHAAGTCRLPNVLSLAEQLAPHVSPADTVRFPPVAEPCVAFVG